MVVNPHPDTVWVCYREEERVVEKSQIIFQRTLSDEEYVKLVGARTGEMVLIYPYNYPQSAGVFIPMILIHHRRTILINGHSDSVLVISSLAKTDMGPQLTFQKCTVPEIAQRKGLATRMLEEQVAAARAFGFEKIVDYADYREGRNGYYTWPRLGFDKELTEKDMSRLHDQFKHFKRLSDLMEDQQAREWWKKHGFALELTFDTSLDSRSMQLLDAALERLKQKGWSWDSGPETPLRVERGTSWRTRRDWQPRTWEYRQD
jgi:GNAT superfamily N-acetyltransferase